MNLTLKRFQIFRAGTHRASDGRMHTFTDGHLRGATNEYNVRKENRAALYIGHPSPAERRAATPYGLVNKLHFDDGSGKLYAEAYVTDDLLNMVRRGKYRAVSAGFICNGQHIKLDHIAFVNNPAVKNMEKLNFTETPSGIVTFEQDLNADDFITFTEPPKPAQTGRSDRSNAALHAAALNHMERTGETDYSAAVRACMSEHPYR